MNFKEFVKYVLVVTMSTIMTLGTLFFLFYLMIVGLAMSLKDLDVEGKTDKKILPGTVLELRLDYPVKEYNDSPFENFDPGTFKFKPSLTLSQIIQTIESASQDPNIEGILIHTGMINTGMAGVEEIKAALDRFKKSGKPVWSYSEIYTQKSYFLSSVSEKILLHPMGIFDWKGLASQILFYKNLLENLGINVQVIRHGKFKSAVEPFVNDKMSEENRLQIRNLLNDFWGIMTKSVSESRSLEINRLNRIANDLPFVTPQEWKQAGFFDDIMDFQGIRDELAKKIDEDEIHFITETDYYYQNKLKNIVNPISAKPTIAVLLAEGEIVAGEGEKNQIGSDRMVRLIRKIAQDDDIKAVVLRINSPGGSALASEIIWKELQLLKEKKPLVVSMGDLAASGGYYIAVASDFIVANPTTITGSIGVFGLIPDFSAFMHEKLHINIDTVKTNPHADMGIFRPLDEKERAYLQKMVEFTYGTFINRVAEGRKMTTEQVDAIGQGRIWSGKRAVELGLVDTTGTLFDAIEKAAEMSDLADYKVKYFPKTENPFALLFTMQNEAETKILNKFLSFFHLTIPSSAKQLFSRENQIQARMAYEIKIVN